MKGPDASIRGSSNILTTPLQKRSCSSAQNRASTRDTASFHWAQSLLFTGFGLRKLTAAYRGPACLGRGAKTHHSNQMVRLSMLNVNVISYMGFDAVILEGLGQAYIIDASWLTPFTTTQKQAMPLNEIAKYHGMAGIILTLMDSNSRGKFLMSCNPKSSISIG